MKVYCDRIAKVSMNTHGQIECPKCHGICNLDPVRFVFNCSKCGRGWKQVPDHVTQDSEAWKYCDQRFIGTEIVFFLYQDDEEPPPEEIKLGGVRFKRNGYLPSGDNFSQKVWYIRDNND